MENLFEENLEIGFESDSSDYPGLQVAPAAAAGVAIVYGVVGGIISGTLTNCVG
jgi:hypothetical protein